MSTTPRTDGMMKFCFGDDREYVRVEDVTKLERELEEAQKENTVLRGIVAKAGSECVYCGLTDKSKCSRGFPGCAWADDLMCGEDEGYRNLISQLTTAKSALEKARDSVVEMMGYFDRMGQEGIQERAKSALAAINAALEESK